MNNGEALTLTMCNTCIVLFVFFKLALPTRLKRGKRGKKTMKFLCCNYKEMMTMEDGSTKKSEKNQTHLSEMTSYV